MQTNKQRFPLPPVQFTFAGFTWPRVVSSLPAGKLSKRLVDRKNGFCGPYYHAPKPLTRPTMGEDNGRAFYLESQGMPGLRWEWCDDVARVGHSGWFTNEFQDEKLRGLIFQLPHGRGFLAGYSAGSGMYSVFEYSVYPDKTDAAYAADSLAEFMAEQQREYEERENEKQEVADARELIAESRAFCRHLIQQYKRDRRVVGSTIIRAAVVNSVSACLASIRKARATIERLEG